MRHALALAFLLAATAVYAQTDEAGLRARLLDHTVFLRTFTSDDNLKFDATGQPVRPYHPASFTNCGFRAETIKLSGHRIQLKGQRIGLIWKRNVMAELPLETGGMRSGPEKLTVEIDMGPAADFGAALDAVFATQLGELTPSLPSFWQAFAREHFEPRPPSAAAPVGRPHQPASEPAASAPPAHVRGTVRPPLLLNSPEPEFSEYARRQKFSGSSQVHVTVGTDGLPTQVSVVRPIGLGLDEKAVEAVSRYKFQPGTRDGEPVAIDLYVEVNFQIF